MDAPSLLLLVGCFLLLLFLRPSAILSRGVILVHSIKFICHIVFGAPPLVRPIITNLALGFFSAPRFKVVKALHITFVGVPSYSIRAGCCEEFLTFSNLDRCIVNKRVLASFGSVLVRSFAATML